MSLTDELRQETEQILRERWTRRDGSVVPDTDNLKLSNDGVDLDATVLYADLAGSTVLVDTKTPTFAAEVYKSYLHCAAKIIRSEEGEITAYDGDRVMAVFIGGYKSSRAIRAAMKINYARVNIINPAIERQYPLQSNIVNHSIGIDTSKLMVARTGIRGANDLVWVGPAANYAAKLSSLDPNYTWITKAVYDRAEQWATEGSNGQNMWESRTWTTMGGKPIYRSNWHWRVE
jgi:class 3 adenylate cyclase